MSSSSATSVRKFAVPSILPTEGGEVEEEGNYPGAMTTRPSWRGLHGDQYFREVSPFSLSLLRSLSSGNALSQPDEDRSRLRPDLGGNSIGWRLEKQPMSEEAKPFGFSRLLPDRFASPRLTSEASLSCLPMSDEPAPPDGTLFKSSAPAGWESGGSGDHCCATGAEDREESAAASPLPPPSENEDSAQKSDSTPQGTIVSEKDALPCRLQNGSSVNSEATKDPASADGSPEEQDVAGKEEILTDQLQQQKEEAVLQVTKYSAPQGPGDIIMIQSEYTGAVDILSAELETTDLLSEQKKVRPPPLIPPTTWTNSKIREFKTKMAKEKNARMLVKRGEVLTVRVPTHPDGKRVCWEFATEDYDIGFGVYFDWTPITSTAITVQVSESSDEEDEEEEFEGPIPVGDVEKGSKSYLRNRYGEIMPVYRRDSHHEVQIGSHDYPGEGIYLLKFDNSYSLLRNKILFFHVYYTS
ncbi:protein TMED8 [Candoia aspera]|uniref:protein TMED8 n=1 Tax=Candoia aspera TaxID=51853 RepID=UPI002FD7FACE